MNIGINLTAFTPGEMGGSETYVRQLIHHLQQVDRDHNYTLFCNPQYEKEFPLFNNSFKFVPSSLTPHSLKDFVCGIIRHKLRLAYNLMKLDVMHHPLYSFDPYGAKIPAVFTFYDMQHEFLPQFFSVDELKERKETYRPLTEQATRVITISQHVKKCLVDRYEIDQDKIDVTYLGCGAEYHAIEDRKALEVVKSKYALDKPFMFYPAATWPHKNHKKLLLALKMLKNNYGFEGSLVLTGIAKQEHNEIFQQIDLLGIANDVILLGYIPYHELPYIYNMARLLVFPSLFEGFGIPLVEAMACGCPVVCSNVTSIPEIIGDAGIMFDPDSVEDMSEKLWQVWTDNALAKDMKLKGFERFVNFKWENTAKKTVESYKKTYDMVHQEKLNILFKQEHRG